MSATSIVSPALLRITAVAASILLMAGCASPSIVDAPTRPAAETEEETPAAPAAEVGTRENPAPVGSVIELSDNSGPIWNVTIGAANLNAADIIAAENMFNEPADAGFQYVLVPVTFTYVGKQTGTAWIDVDIAFVSAAGTTHEQEFVVAPGPSIMDIGELYPDATGTGNMVVMAPTADIEKGTWAIGALFGEKFFVAVQ